MHSRFAYSRLLYHQLLWGTKIKAVKGKKKKQKQYEARIKRKCLLWMSFFSNMATNCHCLRGTSAPHDSPANLLMAGLFHTAPWWRRRPCSDDAGGLAGREAAAACTDTLGLAPIKCWWQKLPAETRRCSSDAAWCWPESSSLKVCQQPCVTLSVRGVRVWYFLRH